MRKPYFICHDHNISLTLTTPLWPCADIVESIHFFRIIQYGRFCLVTELSFSKDIPVSLTPLRTQQPSAGHQVQMCKFLNALFELICRMLIGRCEPPLKKSVV